MSVPDSIIQDWMTYEISISIKTTANCVVELLQLNDTDKASRLAAYLAVRIALKQSKIDALPARETALQDDIDLSNSIIDDL